MKIKEVEPLQAVSACKICHAESELFGVTDFNTACYGDNANRYCYPLTGVPIYYHRCNTCGLIFTRAFDAWSVSDYQQHIYNDDYFKYDPGYADERPKKNHQILMELFSDLRQLNVLDYGGGAGGLCALLAADGVNASFWDPMGDYVYPQENSFDLITSFEVLEHTPDPRATLTEITRFLKPGGRFFFSTMSNDLALKEGMNNWYIAPRNGHITIYSEASMNQLFTECGLGLKHLNQWYHYAIKVV